MTDVLLHPTVEELTRYLGILPCSQLDTSHAASEAHVDPSSSLPVMERAQISDKMSFQHAIALSRASSWSACETAADPFNLQHSTRRSHARSGFHLPRCISPTGPTTSSHSQTVFASVEHLPAIKCVDAPPLVIVRRRPATDVPATAYCQVIVGSHAGLVIAAAWEPLAKRWLEQWTTALPHRVEAAATCSACARIVFIACYDSCVYALDAETGGVLDVFECDDSVGRVASALLERQWMVLDDSGTATAPTSAATSAAAVHEDNPIKCSPTTFSADGHTFLCVADYRKRFMVLVYDADAFLVADSVPSGRAGKRPRAQQEAAPSTRSSTTTGTSMFTHVLVWPVAGSTYAAPQWIAASRLLLTVTTTGFLYAFAFAVATGTPRLPAVTLAWSRNLEAPVFASCVGIPEQHLVVACTVAGTVMALDLNQNGTVRWSIEVGSPVCAAPLVWRAQWLFVPSHGGTLHMLHMSDSGSVSVTTACQLDGKLVSSPCMPWTVTANSDGGFSCTLRDTLLAVCSSTGVLNVFTVDTAGCVPLVSMPISTADVFSSPVWVDALLTVGSRDDYLLGVKMPFQ
jgi:outer membrane protein assembly factor BamB